MKRVSPVVRRFAAFTLVELLVVIGIIALLISILLPSLNAARQSAKVVVCASNLRQLNLAMTMYANDNKGHLIPEITGSSANVVLKNVPTWQLHLKPYFTRLPGGTAINKQTTYDKVLNCPSADGDPDTSGVSVSPFQPYYASLTSFGQLISSYGYNRNMYDYHTFTASPGTNYFVKVYNTSSYYAFQRPSYGKIPLIFDCRNRDARPHLNATPLPEQLAYNPYKGTVTTAENYTMLQVAMNRHKKVINVLFVDGHQESVPVQELWTLNWEPNWTVPNPLPTPPRGF